MSSNIPSPNNNTTQTNNCEWTISVTDCFGQEYFQLVYGVTTYLSLFIFLCSIWLLLWRLYSKPNTKLFGIPGFLSLEGYLFLQIFWGAGRVITCIMLIYNLFPGEWILREVIIELAWFIGATSVITYLAGVLRTIPRLHFFTQHPHYKHSSHLPNLRGITSVYVTYILLLGTIRITCVVFIGYFLQNQTGNSDQIIKILWTIYYCTCSICAILVAIGFISAGNKLVEITSDGLYSLEKAYPSIKKRSQISHSTVSYNMDAELELKYRKLKRSVTKMRIINMAFISSFAALGVIIGIFAFTYEQIFQNIEISKFIAASSNWMPTILNVAVMGGIAYGEMRVPDKSESRLENIVIPSDSLQSNAIELTSSDVEGPSHSRNDSTDSNVPLLNRPVPAAIISTRRGSSQLDSPISATPATPLAGNSSLSKSFNIE